MRCFACTYQTSRHDSECVPWVLFKQTEIMVSSRYTPSTLFLQIFGRRIHANTTGYFLHCLTIVEKNVKHD